MRRWQRCLPNTALCCLTPLLFAGVFNRLLKGHRCIVLLNGFYEWAKVRPGLVLFTAHGKVDTAPHCFAACFR